MSKQSVAEEGRLFDREEARQIRQEYKDGLTYPELAERYNCAPHTIGAVVRRRGAYAGDEE